MSDKILFKADILYTKEKMLQYSKSKFIIDWAYFWYFIVCLFGLLDLLSWETVWWIMLLIIGFLCMLIWYIKKPRIETEAPVRVLYQWFSTKNNPQFTPQIISANEWHRANVYTAPISDSRVSKLSALCGVEYAGVIDNPSQSTEQEPDIDLSLLG